MFWLDAHRARDAQIIRKVKTYVAAYDLSGLEIKILQPVDAIKFPLERIRRGEDIISVTGNLLRDRKLQSHAKPPAPPKPVP